MASLLAVYGDGGHQRKVLMMKVGIARYTFVILKALCQGIRLQYTHYYSMLVQEVMEHKGCSAQEYAVIEHAALVNFTGC